MGENLPTEYQQQSPMTVIQQAIQSGADLEKLEKAMALHEKWEAMQAKKAYVEAMAQFKANPPKIMKDKHVRFQTTKGVTEYHHATLANITDILAGALSQHGLHAAWKTEQADRMITVTCTITHSMGHSESTSLTGAPDDSGGKNAIQAVGSTVSYLCRYTLMALTGLASHDMDDDGRGAGKPIEYITEDKQAEISAAIKELYGEKTGPFWAWAKKALNAESVGQIKASDYKAAKMALDKTREAMKK